MYHLAPEVGHEHTTPAVHARSSSGHAPSRVTGSRATGLRSSSLFDSSPGHGSTFLRFGMLSNSFRRRFITSLRRTNAGRRNDHRKTSGRGGASNTGETSRSTSHHMQMQEGSTAIHRFLQETRNCTLDSRRVRTTREEYSQNFRWAIPTTPFQSKLLWGGGS